MHLSRSICLQLTPTRKENIDSDLLYVDDHKNRFLWGIRVTASQPRVVAFLNSPSTSRCIFIDITNLLML